MKPCASLLSSNRLAVIQSWVRAPKEFLTVQGWNVSEEWRFAEKKNQAKPQEFFGYEKWKEAVRIFESLQLAYPKRCFLVRYEHLISEVQGVLRELFDSCALPWNRQTERFIEESTSRQHSDVYSVYRARGHRATSHEKFDPDIVNEILRDLKRERLEKYVDSHREWEVPQ